MDLKKAVEKNWIDHILEWNPCNPQKSISVQTKAFILNKLKAERPFCFKVLKTFGLLVIMPILLIPE